MFEDGRPLSRVTEIYPNTKSSCGASRSFFTQHLLAHFLPLCPRLFLSLCALCLNRSLLPIQFFLRGIPD